MINTQISDLKIWFLEHSQYLVKTSKNKPSGKNVPEKMKNCLKYICTENNRLAEQDMIDVCGGKRLKSPPLL